MHSVDDLVVCLGYIIGHVGWHIQSCLWKGWWRSQEFMRKNVTRVLFVERIMCVKCIA